MTTLVWREEVSADALGKKVISERCVLAVAETGPSGANGNTVDRYRLKPLQRAVVGPIRELEAERQNGNLGLVMKHRFICLVCGSSRISAVNSDRKNAGLLQRSS